MRELSFRLDMAIDRLLKAKDDCDAGRHKPTFAQRIFGRFFAAADEQLECDLYLVLRWLRIFLTSSGPAPRGTIIDAPTHAKDGTIEVYWVRGHERPCAIAWYRGEWRIVDGISPSDGVSYGLSLGHVRMGGLLAGCHDMPEEWRIEITDRKA